MKSKYYCECCNYDAKVKSSYDKHIKTKKHLECIQNVSKCIQMYPKNDQMYPKCIHLKHSEPENKFKCKYCNKSYRYSQGLSKHIRYTCKKNKDEDLQELVKLMNEQLNEQKEVMRQIKDEMKYELYKKDKEIERRDKQIVKLSTKLQINNNNCIIQNNNIQLLNYRDTDLSHLSDNDYINSIKRVNNCVKILTERIHYNPKKPENMNIYISNLKNDYVTVYDNGQWVLKKGFDDIYDHKEILLEEWLDKEQDKYPELRDKFEEYLNNKENDELLNNIKDDIKLMMYNNKNQIVKKN